MKFKLEHTQEERKQESDRIRAKYPDRIPVICEKTEKSSVQDIDKKKYLVTADLTCGQFVYVIRKRLKLPAEQAIYLFVNGSVCVYVCFCLCCVFVYYVCLVLVFVCLFVYILRKASCCYFLFHTHTHTHTCTHTHMHVCV